MRLTPDERSLLRDNVSDVVWMWALRLMDSGAVDGPPPSAGPIDEATRAAGELARLAAMEEIRLCLGELSSRAAQEAGDRDTVDQMRTQIALLFAQHKSFDPPPSPYFLDSRTGR